jgi:uncharacterized RDD family membrane protein YckC
LASSWSSSPDYAGFWQRAVALVIDWLIVVVILAPLVVVLGPRTWDLLGLLAVAVAVIGFWRYCGATPGKIAVGLKIVDAATGGPPPLGRLVLRFFAYFVSAFPLYLGFLWAAFDRRKQGWHDKIARTIVINSEE